MFLKPALSRDVAALPSVLMAAGLGLGFGVEVEDVTKDWRSRKGKVGVRMSRGDGKSKQSSDH